MTMGDWIILKLIWQHYKLSVKNSKLLPLHLIKATEKNWKQAKRKVLILADKGDTLKLDTVNNNKETN